METGKGGKRSPEEVFDEQAKELQPAVQTTDEPAVP
jgi:hypothetical protein